MEVAGREPVRYQIAAQRLSESGETAESDAGRLPGRHQPAQPLTGQKSVPLVDQNMQSDLGRLRVGLQNPQRFGRELFRAVYQIDGLWAGVFASCFMRAMNVLILNPPPIQIWRSRASPNVKRP